MEERGLLLVYCKVPGVKNKMANLRSEMDQKLPSDQIHPCSDHSANWSYVSHHMHSSGEELEIWHLGCNLHVPN